MVEVIEDLIRRNRLELVTLIAHIRRNFFITKNDVVYRGKQIEPEVVLKMLVDVIWNINKVIIML